MENFFFDEPEKIVFGELRFFLEYSFDVKIHDLSIGCIFRAIPALFHGVYLVYIKNIKMSPQLLVSQYIYSYTGPYISLSS